jgi:epoxyqueuosine reductase QueG
VSGHPVVEHVGDAGFVVLGWFKPGADDGVPQISGGTPAVMVLIGNAGSGMFDRFASERDPREDSLDDWTRAVVGRLAERCGASALYPFDKPPLPFLTWGRRARCGHVSPLGLNIHPVYGLWHAFRAALLFDRDPGLPAIATARSPCDSCIAKPCLTACPVGAFVPGFYDVAACAGHLMAPAGGECMEGGCLARRACPVGTAYQYTPDQMRFHMAAFRRARCFSLEHSGKI